MKTAAMALIALLALGIAAAWAGPPKPKKPSFDYGTSCYGLYGHTDDGNISRAIISLKRYFAKNGLEAKVLAHYGRFLKADIYRDGEVIDSIIVDISTGKMRSIY